MTQQDTKSQIDINKNVQKYKNTLNSIDLIFNGYTIEEIIEDLSIALFDDIEYPWEDPKYEKKIHRVVYFLIIYLSNTYSNFDEIKEYLKKFFDKYDLETQNDLVFKTYGVKSLNDADNIYRKILNNLSIINKKIPQDNNDYKEKMDNIKTIFIQSFDLFVSATEEQTKKLNEQKGPPEYVPYLKKYLKYKKKYLELKIKN